MITNNFLWLALGAALLLLGLFILTDLFDKLIDYVAYVLIVLGAVVMVGAAGYMIYLVNRRK